MEQKIKKVREFEVFTIAYVCGGIWMENIKIAQ